jgi:hypothetical protein
MVLETRRKIDISFRVDDANRVSSPSEGPSPVILDKVIATSAEALAYYAFDVAPSAAVSADGPIASIAAQVRWRLAQFWPELAAGLTAPRRLSRRNR